MKTPSDGLMNYCKMSCGGWQYELKQIRKACFSDIAKLGRGRMLDANANPEAMSLDVRRRIELGLCLIAERAWSSIISYGTPPMMYANILHHDQAVRDDYGRLMRADWCSILQMEKEAHKNINVRNVCGDAAYMLQKATRVMFMLFERGKFNPDYAPFKDYMINLLQVLPDSRIVEQTHMHLRKLEHDNPSMVTARHSRQSCCTNSGIMEERGIKNVVVTKDEWKYEFPHLRQTGMARKSEHEWMSSKHKLPRRWSKVMAPVLSWRSPTPKSMRTDVGALLWALEFYGNGLSRQGTEINDAMCCRMLVEQSLVRRTSDNNFFIILSVTKWCAIAMPIIELVDGVYSTRSGLDILCIFVYGFEDFKAVPCIPIAPNHRQGRNGADMSHGIVFKKIGMERSLAKHAMFHKACCLDNDTLVSIASHYALEFDSCGTMSGGGTNKQSVPN